MSDDLALFPEGTTLHEVVLPSGLRMRFYARGDESKPTAIFLHGFPELACSWRAQFDALSDDWFVVAPDMRGYGGTDAPRRVADYRLEHLRRDVVELIDELGGDRVHLVGHDWGGAVAWDVAQHEGARLRSLAVLNCPPAAMMLREMLNPRQARMSWYVFFFQLPILPELWAARNVTRLIRGTFRGTAVNKTVFTDEVLAPYETQVRERGLPGLNYYRAAARHPVRHILPVRVPTALIWGLGDQALGPWFSDPERYGFVEDFTRYTIAEAGHWVQQEAAAQVSAKLREHWLRAFADR